MNDGPTSFTGRLGRPPRRTYRHHPLKPDDARRKFGELLQSMLDRLSIEPAELDEKNSETPRLLPATLFATSEQHPVADIDRILKGTYTALTPKIVSGLRDRIHRICKERGIDQRRAGRSNWPRLEQLATMIDGEALPADSFFKSSGSMDR